MRAAHACKIPLAVVQRTIWAAHLEFIDRVLADDQGYGLLVPAESPGLIDRHTALTHQYLAKISRIYNGMGAASGSTPSSQMDRTELLLSIVAGRQVDEGMAGEYLGVRFDEHHAAAVLTSTPGRGVSSIDLVRFSLTFSRAVGGHRPLVALNGAAEVWMWTRWADQPVTGKVTRLSSTLPVPPGFRMVLGPVGPGVRGFRRSMLVAQAAQRALGSAAPKHWLSRYEDVPAVRLLTSEEEQANWWAEEVLGDLARDDGYHSELRETLRLYLVMGRSRAQVATAVHVHRNTIAYRVEKALSLLGRPIEDDDFHVRLALEIARISDAKATEEVGAAALRAREAHPTQAKRGVSTAAALG
ncbi:MAG TPA: helix-turn-helix domain-containing protein [Kineosporiaceae bacterium]